MPSESTAVASESTAMISESPAITMPSLETASNWTASVEQLLQDWRNRAYAAQSAHYASAGVFRLANYVLGVPAVVFSSIVGTAIFAGFEKDTPSAFAVASVSILAAVLAGLQTFLRFPERAASHGTAADWYAAVRRDIEELLHLPVELRGNPKECLDTLRKEMNRAAQDAPDLRVRVWKREARRFGVREPAAPPRG